MTQPCPCGSDANLEACCQPIIDHRSAATAEQLMRSRYTAYVLRDADYLLDTWHPSTRPSTLEPSEEQRWLGLKIKATQAGLPKDSEGLVEFVARYKIAGKGFRLHEISRFSRHGGRWVYVDGEFPTK